MIQVTSSHMYCDEMYQWNSRCLISKRSLYDGCVWCFFPWILSCPPHPCFALLTSRCYSPSCLSPAPNSPCSTAPWTPQKVFPCMIPCTPAASQPKVTEEPMLLCWLPAQFHPQLFSSVWTLLGEMATTRCRYEESVSETATFIS